MVCGMELEASVDVLILIILEYEDKNNESTKTMLRGLVSYDSVSAFCLKFSFSLSAHSV